MKKLILILIISSLFSSCYDMEEHSLERQADYQQQQVQQLKRIADNLDRLCKCSYYIQDSSETFILDHSEIKQFK